MKISITSAILALALEGAHAAAVKADDPQYHCCPQLARLEGFEDKVWTSTDERYTERLTQYYSANAALAPWCMVFPESTEDVAEIVKVLNEYQCPFGMRSGGHSAFKGSNGIEDGVTVDFGHMKTTTYDESTQIASIQPGSTWGEAYQVLAPYNVVAVGGRADVVGVGGFTTGGGYSFHTGVRGFACDNVKNFEVVLSDGSVVDANAEQNADLFKALKGGSGNFGFVTRIDVEVWTSPNIYASLNSFSTSVRKLVMKAYYRFVLSQDDEPASQTIMSQSYTRANGYRASAILSNIDANITSGFTEFLDIPALVNSPSFGPAHEVVRQFTGPTPLGLYANWQTGLVAHDKRMFDQMDVIFHEYIEKMRAAAPGSFEMIFQWQPVTKGIVEISKSKGGNVLGLEAAVADGPALMYNIVFTVDTAENQELVLPFAFEMNNAILEFADANGFNRDWQFLNYAHGTQDPLSHYGAENIALMKAVSDNYDSGKVFQNLRKTGFHLPL